MNRVVVIDRKALELPERGELLFPPAPVGNFFYGAEAVFCVVEPCFPVLVLPFKVRVVFAMASMDVVVGEREGAAFGGFCQCGSAMHGALDTNRLPFFVSAEQGKERCECPDRANFMLELREGLRGIAGLAGGIGGGGSENAFANPCCGSLVEGQSPGW